MNRLITALLVFLFKVVKGRRGPRNKPAEIQNVLLVSTTGLGDTVLSTPAVAAARKAWPEAKLHVFVHVRWSGLLEACPHLETVIEYPGKFRRVWRLIRQFRKFHLNAAFVLHHNDPDILPLVYLSGAQYIVCRSTTKFNFLLDVSVKNLDPSRHIAQRRLDLIQAVAGDVPSSDVEIFLPERKRKWAMIYWEKKGLSEDERFVALNPGGSHQAKQWPSEHWKLLLNLILDSSNLRVVLVGSPTEKALMYELAFGSDRNKVMVTARQDVMESAALLERALVLVGPDSGLGHLASAMNIPVIILFGPDRPDLTRPFSTKTQSVIIQADPKECPHIAACRKKVCRPNLCMESIRPDRVMKELSRFLVQNAVRQRP